MKLTAEHLAFSYGDRPVLRDVSFTATSGELLSILGPNGVGKSTLFRCVLGTLRHYGGSISIDGDDLRDMAPKLLAQRVAYIPQSSYPAFNYSVLDMVLMGTSVRAGPFSPPRPEEEAVALEALERLGVAELAGRDFTRLSGGERQLVLIARALAQKAPVLLMDEPTANLDYGNQIRVLTQIRALAEAGYAVIQTTHDPEQAYQFSHRILAMKDGTVARFGPPQAVMTAELIRALYGIDVELESLRGDRLRVCIPVNLKEEKE